MEINFQGTMAAQSKYCTRCNTFRPISEWSKNNQRKDGLHGVCKVCSRETNRAWYKTHREERLPIARKSAIANRRKLKLEVLTHYGSDLGKPKCVTCGDERLPCLTIDHINGGGAEHRRSLGTRNICQWLKKKNFPYGYQTLCMNCQFMKKYENKEWH